MNKKHLYIASALSLLFTLNNVTASKILSTNAALKFDGIKDYIEVADNERLRPSHITVEAWVKPSSFNAWATVLMKSSGNSWTDGIGFSHYTGNSDINFFINNYQAHKVSGRLNLNEWAHIAGTYDGQKIILFINGLPIDSTTYSAVISHSASPLFIGRGAGVGYFWDGIIDEVRIWNEALTGAQIQENMNRRLDGTQSGLVAYWRFDEGDGVVADDATGNGNVGNLVNTPAWVISTAPVTDSNLLAKPLEIDFGSVLLGKSITDSVIVKNLGQNILTVNSIQISGLHADRFRVNTVAFALDPGNQKSLSVIFAPSTKENHSANIEIESSDGNISIKLTGKGIACVEPSTDIISWWPFDSTAMNIVADIVGNDPGIPANGPIDAEGIVGKSLRFDGRNDYVGIADNDLWAFGSHDFAIELWANWDAPGRGTLDHPGDVFISHDEGPGTARKWLFALGGGVLNFHINGPGIGAKYFPQVSFSPVIGRWYHLAVTREGSNYKIYVDGVVHGTATNNDSIPNPNAPLLIGQSNEPFGGFMNGRLDEVTIYNRALSDAEVQDIFYAERAGKCKNLSIATEALPAIKLGEFFSQKFKAIFGEPLSWEVIGGNLPDGVNLSSEGVLSGSPAEAGEFMFIVRVTDNSDDYAEKEFTLRVLVALPPPNIRIRKTGTTPVPGRTLDYFILIENVGDVMSINIPVVESLDPSHFTLLSADPPPAIGLDTLIVLSAVIWNIPELLPGESVVLHYQAVLAPSAPLGVNVGGTLCFLDEVFDVMRECFVDLGGSPATCSCVPEDCFSGSPTRRQLTKCLACYASCLGLGIPALIKCFKEKTGGKNPEAEKCFENPKPATGPGDPNEKLVSADKFIQSDQPLLYPIHFENSGNVQARDIYVTDVLDSNLDISTLKILTPAGASFDAATRALKWELLNKNLEPGKTDNVLLSIKPLAGLPDGTKIRNKAEIQFEVFNPITTNEVVSIIDKSPPVAKMDSLPPEISKLEFPISWSGKDSIGEIESYTIFVSVDSSGFTPFLETTRESTAKFAGEPGRTYSFICIAKDKAGNMEIQEPVAETTTFITKATSVKLGDDNLPSVFAIWQNFPNPFNPSTSIRFDLPRNSEVKILIFDILGRKVRTLVDRKLSAGSYLEIWNGKNDSELPVASGVYFVRMQAGDFTAVRKLVFIE